MVSLPGYLLETILIICQDEPSKSGLQVYLQVPRGRSLNYVALDIREYVSTILDSLVLLVFFFFSLFVSSGISDGMGWCRNAR